MSRAKQYKNQEPITSVTVVESEEETTPEPDPAIALTAKAAPSALVASTLGPLTVPVAPVSSPNAECAGVNTLLRESAGEPVDSGSAIKATFEHLLLLAVAQEVVQTQEQVALTGNSVAKNAPADTNQELLATENPTNAKDSFLVDRLLTDVRNSDIGRAFPVLAPILAGVCMTVCMGYALLATTVLGIAVFGGSVFNALAGARVITAGDAGNVTYMVIYCTSPVLSVIVACVVAERFRIMRLPAWVHVILAEFSRLKVPLVLLLSLLTFPKLVLLWIPLALIWSGCEWLWPRLPLRIRLYWQKTIPHSLQESRLVSELSEGISQARPFILFALYIFCLPVALIWMFCHWLRRLVVRRPEDQTVPAKLDTLSFVQNPRTAAEESDANFFHSPAFAISCITLFGCGLPAFVTLLLYQHLGVDAMLGFPSTDPNFKKHFFSIDLYMYSVGCCLSVLFLRSWFTFPLNFFGEEAIVDMDKKGIRKRSNCWFTQVLTWNSPWSGIDSLTWDEIKYVGAAQHCTRLYPLPTTGLSADSLLYRTLNPLAMFIDSISPRSNFEEYLYFRTQERGGNEVKIQLSGINGDGRARLFYAIRQWAPTTTIDDRVQEKMIGSSVLQAPRYTQMWFDLLTDRMQRKKNGALSPGQSLRDGAFNIVNRIASGGQANVYLALDSEEKEVVLKEFILSNSDAVGSLVESAAEFETESTLLSQLAHPNIVRMLDFFAEDRRIYIVLEKVHGTTLRQLIRRTGEPLSEAQVIAIGLQLCDILEYLHGLEPSVVHRDIAPDNIMFDHSNGIKLIDFSLAAAKKSKRTTSTMGKHCYSPPEQFREQICPQSDIYALGATMCFLLTGEDPKPITPSDPRARCPHISVRLSEILLRATAFELADRYSDISWVKLELQSLEMEQQGDYRPLCGHRSKPSDPL